jgi:similar to stage IV sporulation protein
MTATIWNIVIGCAIIQIEGVSLERLVNLASENRITLNDCKRLAYTRFEARVSALGLYRLKRLLHETPYVLTEIKKTGLPFSAKNLWSRKALIAGAAASAILIFILTSLIWSIEIETRENVNVALIRENLNRLGIKPGMLKKDIDPDRIQNELMMSDPRLGWVGLRISGVKLQIEAVGAIGPQAVPDDIPVNILADKDAMIETLEVYEGWPAVKEGQVVTRGTLLVSGMNQTPDGSVIKRVHARARIAGRAWYVGRAGASLIESTQARTGAKSERAFLCLGGWKIPISGTGTEWQEYETEKVKISGLNIYFPFYIMKETYFQLERSDRFREMEPLQQQLHHEALRCAMAQVPEDVTVEQISFVDILHGQDQIEAQAFIQTLDEIGQDDPISTQ